MKYLCIKNWRKHQQYKKRQPPWIKVAARLIDAVVDGGDPAYNELPDPAKLLLIHLWLLASRHNPADRDHAFLPYDLGWLRGKVNTKAPLASTIASIVASGLLTVVESNASTPASVVLLTTLSLESSVSESEGGAGGNVVPLDQGRVAYLRHVLTVMAPSCTISDRELTTLLRKYPDEAWVAAVLVEKHAYLVDKGAAYVSEVLANRHDAFDDPCGFVEFRLQAVTRVGGCCESHPLRSHTEDTA